MRFSFCVCRFFSFLVLPLFTGLATAFPDCQPLLDAIRANLARWQETEGDPATGQPLTRHLTPSQGGEA